MSVTAMPPRTPPPPVTRSPRGTRRWRPTAELRAVPWAPAALVLGGLIFMRPNLAGEALSPVGFAFAVAAAVVALLRRDAVPVPPALSARTMSIVATLVVAACFWAVLKTAAMDPSAWVRSAFQDLVLTGGTLVAVVVAAQDVVTRRLLARGFVLLLAVLCASYLVTVLIWVVAGVGSAEITAVPVGDLDPQPVYFPFTISYADQAILGTDVPRFTGIGRESGWMAMYCAAGFFLAGTVGLGTWKIQGLLLVGLLGTISTAGFGVFVVVWVADRFLRPRGEISVPNYLRQVIGLAAVPAAIWVATSAPIVGVSAKQDQNVDSVTERQDAVSAGLRALGEWPWGGRPTEKQGGINLIADIAVNGLPYVLLIAAALLVPMLFLRRIGRGAMAASVVFLTMLLSQPATASTWAFCLVALAYGCDELPAAATRPRRRRRGRSPVRVRRDQTLDPLDTQGDATHGSP
jgi:hypothetical protein